MPKKIIQDVKSNTIKTIRILNTDDGLNIDKKKENHVDVVDTLYHESFDKSKNKKHKIKNITDINYKRSKNSFLYYILFISIVLSIVYYACNYFSFANIVVNNKKQSIPIENVSFNAYRNNTEGVNFEVMILSDEIEKEITLSESQNVSNKATGTVTFYNTYSSKTEKIASGTLVADKAGKTYKLDKTIIIPGFKTIGGKIIPGTFDTTITAFLAGESYNSTEKDFYVTSFKGSSKYEKIYIKAKSDIKGGASGLVYKLSANDKGKLESISESIIKNQLLKKLQAEIPDEYIFYPNTVSFSSSFDENQLYNTKDAKVKITTNMTAPIFSKVSLSEAIIRNLFKDIKDNEFKEIVITNLPKIDVSFSSQGQKINKETDSFSIKINSVVDLVWYPNTQSLTQSLLGIHKKDLQNIFNQDNGISSVDVKIFPFWESYIPSSAQKVHVSLK